MMVARVMYVMHGPYISGRSQANVIAATQDYEGASDLDLKPAVESERVLVCRVFAQANTKLDARFFFDTSHWTPATAIEPTVEDPDGGRASGQEFNRGTGQGIGVQLNVRKKGFHSFFVQAANTPTTNKAPSYKLSLTYTAPQTL
jgi:hypothetical protein